MKKRNKKIKKRQNSQKQKSNKIFKASIYAIGIGAIIFTVIMILFAALR